MDVKKIGLEGVDWIHMAQNRDSWRATVNTVVKPRVPEKAGSSGPAESF
jgi:hypothetical protein